MGKFTREIRRIFSRDIQELIDETAEKIEALMGQDQWIRRTRRFGSDNRRRRGRFQSQRTRTERSYGTNTENFLRM